MLFQTRTPLDRMAYLIPLISGIALIPAFPPLDQGYLAWLALTPLLWFCLKARPRQAVAAGFIFGIPLHLYLNTYLAGVLFTHLTVPLSILVQVLLVLFLASFNAVFTLALSYLRRLGNSLAVAFAMPALWLLMEYTRSLGFIAYNVGYIGYTQWRYPFILNTAAVFGYWGIAYIMVAFQSIAVLAAARYLRGKALFTALAVLLLMLAAGTMLPEVYPAETNKEPLWTALIQGNSSTEEILDGAGRQEILRRYLDYTRQAVEEEPRVKMVIWPETVVDLFLVEKPAHRPQMEELARQLNVSILYGARVRDGGNLYNAVVLLNPAGEYQAYSKQRLVPFVEYFPLEALLNQLLDLDVILGSYTAGEEITIFDYFGIPLAGVICFESYFGDYIRLFAREGSKHLFILTNDAWFGDTHGLEQHAQVAAIRAAETGIGVTQVANSGITISFDFRGRELLRSGKSEAAIFALPLDLAGRKSFYVKFGDFLPAACLVYLILFTTYSLVRKFKNSPYAHK
ncbi:MAG: apolipoprotein N-acyltransferase [Bacillota bacterium]